jgi:hypothetical protein
MKGFVLRTVRAGVLAVALGVAAVPAVTAAAPAEASTSVMPLTATCGVFNAGPTGVSAYCWGSGGVGLTVVCTNGTSWGFAFAPTTLTVTCPPGGTVVSWSLG